MVTRHESTRMNMKKLKKTQYSNHANVDVTKNQNSGDIKHLAGKLFLSYSAVEALFISTFHIQLPTASSEPAALI